MEFTRVNNDTCGNPRYVLHFLECEPETWKDYTLDLSTRYARTVKLMNQKGLWGRKFHNRQFGGGIVFQTYNTDELAKRINEVKAKIDAEKEV